jgi:DNA invertase Pin-like site-specific DNA recombinase
MEAAGKAAYVPHRPAVRLPLVIYTRYSSDMQRADSCTDQVRKAKEDLVRRGISIENAEIIKDEAESGTKENRPGYARITQRIAAGEPMLLVVDDQSRLGRTENIRSQIQDLVFNEGRFIAVADGIDTDRVGWETSVGFKEISNAQYVRDLGAKVRRGQEGRILDGCGSAGDYPYGYRSEYVDPNWDKLPRRGPKPKKKVVIFEEEAAVVRQIFVWFNEGRAKGWIVRELNRRGVPKAHRSTRPGWYHELVTRIIKNPKYIGKWTWGKTRIIRGSKDRKKQIAAAPEDVHVVERPDLRIIDVQTWKCAQLRVAEMKKVHGLQPGQRQRGPKMHYTALYPKSLLGGLLFCGECGSRLIYQAGGTDVYFGCPQHKNGRCTTTVRVPQNRGEDVLLEFLCSELTRQPEWIATVMTALSAHLNELKLRLPAEIEAKAKERDKLQREMENLTDALAQGSTQSQTLLNGIREREARVEQLNTELIEYHRFDSVPDVLPNESEVLTELAALSSVLHEKSQEAALLLRRILGKVNVHEMPIRGKRRGHIQVRFEIKAWRVAMELFKTNPAVLFMMDKQDDMATPTVCLNVSTPTKMDEWAPQIADMRKQGIPWSEIGKRTGLQPGNAYTAWKRYVDGKESDSKTG